jgi:hypothetical protein
VQEVLNKLDVKKAYGPDGIPPIVYNKCASILTPSITLMLNLSLNSGVIPMEWKMANVVPVHKKGDKANVANYRPISLLPVISKVLERCVHTYLYGIIKNDIIENQHGFTKRKSTNTQLVEFYDGVYSNADNGIQTDVVYLDLSKAFDSVPHNFLILKLKAFGVNGQLLNWFINYLDNRKQKVILDGHSSDYVNVISGVPQGSILGPLLFNIYINDMSKVITSQNSHLFLYADDSKLCSQITCLNDCFALQSSINELYNWSNIWGMRFNHSKCCILSFKSSPNKIIHNYYMNANKINRSNCYEDLGILVSDNLKWDDHICKIVNKANKRLGLIKRCVGNCNMEIKLLCYKSLIRPILECGSCVWACPSKKMVNKLETVQRRATKFILHDFSIDYDSRLFMCTLLPLTLRREYLDLVFFYNFVHSLVDVKLSTNFILYQNNRTRHHVDELSLAIPRCNTNNYSKMYNNRIVRVWNSLPYNIRCLELSDAGYNHPFKKALKEWIFSYFVSNFDVNNVCSWSIYCGCSSCCLV